jgi:hypothetical protein
VTETYRPSGDEVDAFNEELREYARDPDFRAHAAEGVRLLALAHWPGRNVRVRTPSLGVNEWVESDADQYFGHDKQREPAAAPTAEVERDAPPTERAPQQGPQSSAQMRAEALHRAVETGHPVTQAYGMQGQGAKLVTAGADYDGTSRVFDAHGTAKGRAADGLDEQARAELARLPEYGQPGSEKNKKRAQEIRQAAGRRAAQRALTGPAVPPAAPISDSRAFINEVERRQASADPMQRITSHRQLSDVAHRHGIDPATYGRR